MRKFGVPVPVEVGDEGDDPAGDPGGVALGEDVAGLEVVGPARRAVGVGLAHDPVDGRGRRIGRRRPGPLAGGRDDAGEDHEERP
jgi:hypothetical protein